MYKNIFLDIDLYIYIYIYIYIYAYLNFYIPTYTIFLHILAYTV